MRNFLSIIFLIALFIAGSINTTYSQNDQKPKLLWVQIERALPSKVFEYEDAQKNANEFFKKYLPSAQFYAYSSEDDTYYYFFEIENLDDITKLYQSIGEVTMKEGKDEMQKVTSAFRDKTYSMESEVYVYDKEYSYEPKEPRVKPEEVGFERWVICEYYPYFDEEALNTCKKEIKEYYEKNNIPGGYQIYNKVFGGNQYISVMSESGKNRLDYLNYAKDWGDKYWEGFKSLYLKFMSFVKDFKIVDVWFRKDLSVTKENIK
jgi:hypothetical protein